MTTSASIASMLIQRTAASLTARVHGGTSAREATAMCVEAVKQVASRRPIQVAMVSVTGDYEDSCEAGLAAHEGFGNPTTVLGGVVAQTTGVPHNPRHVTVTALCHDQLQVTPFRFEKEARDHARVGRYNIAGRVEDNFDMADFTSVSSAPMLPLPSVLAGLTKSSSSSLQPTFLLMSDSNSDAYLKSLDAAFPLAVKAGMVAHPTPFMTGIPFTMFLNDRVEESGLIGVAINGPIQSKTKAIYPMRFLGKPMRLTKSRGNMIVEMDGLNPAQLLLDLVQADVALTGPFGKEDHVFLALSHTPVSGDESSNMPAIMKQEDFAILRVIGGDPGRGPVAVDTTRDLQEGHVVQFARVGDPSARNNIAGSEPATPQEPSACARLYFRTAEALKGDDDMVSAQDVPVSKPTLSDDSDVRTVQMVDCAQGCLSSIGPDGSRITTVHRLPHTVVSLSLFDHPPSRT